MRKKILLLAILISVVTFNAKSQEAFIQFINNAPQLGFDGGPRIDIYINNVVIPSLRGLSFRHASPFISLPTDVTIDIKVRLFPSTLADSVITSVNMGLLEVDRRYVIVANGTLGNLPGLPPFTLHVNPDAQDNANSNDVVTVGAFHGAILLPEVEFKLRDGQVLFDADYADFTPYVDLPADLYYLDITVKEFQDLVYTHRVDLRPLEGQAALIFASGPAIGAPELGFYAALRNGTVIDLPFSPVAKVQWVHACGGEAVDLYFNFEKIIDDLPFKGATTYMYVPAEQLLEIGFAPDDSEDFSDVFDTAEVFFENLRTYVVTSAGIYNDPNLPLSIVKVIDLPDSMAISGKDSFLVFHNVPWIEDIKVNDLSNGFISDSLGLFKASNWRHIPGDGVFFDFIHFNDSSFIDNFYGLFPEVDIPFGIPLIWSGLSESEPRFLIGILPDGSVFEFDRLEFSKGQFVQNVPNQVFDIYVNGFKIIDNFEFAQASPFVDLPRDIEFTLGVAPSNSSSVRDTLASWPLVLEENKAYHLILSGILNNPVFPLELIIHDEALLTASDPNQFDLNVFAGSQGAPALNLKARIGFPTFEELVYKEITPYANLQPGVYRFDVELSGFNDAFATYEGDFSNYEGLAGLLMMNGVFGADPAFGIYLVLPDGEVIALEQRAIARFQMIHNATDQVYDIYINDNLYKDDWSYKSATEYIDFNIDSIYHIGIAPSGSSDVSESILTFTEPLIGGRNYQLMIYGIEGDQDFPLRTHLFDNSRLVAMNASRFEFNLFQGCSSLPVIDAEFLNAPNAVNRLAYGQSSVFLSSDPADRGLKLISDSDGSLLATLLIEGQTLHGQVFSLIFGGVDSLEAFAVFPDGSVVDVNKVNTTRVQFVQNITNISADLYIGGHRARQSLDYRNATPYIEVIADRFISVSIAPARSQSVTESFFTDFRNFSSFDSHQVFMNGDTSDTDIPPILHVLRNARQAATQSQNFDLLIHQGSPDIVALDFGLHPNTTLLEGLTYGSFSPYYSFDENNQILIVNDDGFYGIDFKYYLDLNDLKGQSGTLFSSGFGSGSPNFDLFIVLADGSVRFLTRVELSKFQWIHNSPGVGPVDVYYNNRKIISGISYLDDAMFTDIPNNIPAFFEILPMNIDDADSVFVELNVLPDANVIYAAFIQGLPRHIEFPMRIQLISNILVESGNEDRTSILFSHGAIIEDEISIQLRYIRKFVDFVSFGEVVDYQSLISLPYILDMLDSESKIKNTYKLELQPFESSALVLFLAGNESDPDFPIGLYIMNTAGEISPLQLQNIGRIQMINMTDVDEIDVYWRDEKIVSSLSRYRATSYLEIDSSDDQLKIAPSGSNSSGESIYSYPLSIINNQDAQITFGGKFQSSSYPLTAALLNNARLQSINSEKTDIIVAHLLNGEPTIGMDLIPGDIINLVSMLNYGFYSSYIEVESFVNWVRLNTSEAGVVYVIPNRTFESQAITLLAVEEDGWQAVYVVLSNGICFPLDILVGTHTAAIAGSMTLYPNPLTGNELTLAIDFNQPCTECSLRLIDLNGKDVFYQRLNNIHQGQINYSINLSVDLNGLLFLQLICREGVMSKPLIKIAR
jgi:hypothetical protein